MAGAGERGSRPPVRVAVTELRDDLAEWLNRVAWGGETLLVHRRGRPLALVVPFRGEAAAAAPDPAGRSPLPPPPPAEEAGPGMNRPEAGEEGPAIATGAASGEPEPMQEECVTLAEPELDPGGDPGGAGEDAAAERERDREDLRAIFRAIAASAGDVPRAWRPVRPDGPRVRLLASAARELRALGGERRAAAERLLDLLAAGSLGDVPALPGTGGRVYRFAPETGEGGLLWRREEDGSLTVLVVRPPESDAT